MAYTVTGYAVMIVIESKCEIVNWPQHIPFGNPISPPVGISTIEYLIDLLDRDVIRFVAASEERVMLAQNNSRAVMPATPAQ